MTEDEVCKLRELAAKGHDPLALSDDEAVELDVLATLAEMEPDAGGPASPAAAHNRGSAGAAPAPAT